MNNPWNFMTWSQKGVSRQDEIVEQHEMFKGSSKSKALKQVLSTMAKGPYHVNR